jgi:hypothetical protein
MCIAEVVRCRSTIAASYVEIRRAFVDQPYCSSHSEDVRQGARRMQSIPADRNGDQGDQGDQGPVFPYLEARERSVESFVVPFWEQSFLVAHRRFQER